MPMPVLRNFNVLGEILVHKYERYLPTAFDESLTLLEKVNKVINYLNETGELVNDIVEDWNKVMEWVLNEGLTDDVNRKLDEMATDGTLEQIINVDMIGVLGDLETNYTGDLVGAINENVAELAETTTDLNGRGINVLFPPNNLLPVKNDGTEPINMNAQEIIDYVSNNGGGRVIFPQGVYLLDVDSTSLNDENGGLWLRNNVEIEGNEAVFIMNPSNSERYYFFRVIDVENVSIKGIKIKGDIDTHIGSTGEWGYGIQMLRSKNVTLDAVKINDTWGDSLLIGGFGSDTSSPSTCENVTLRDIEIDKAGRNGIAITSCNGLFAENIRISNIVRTFPKSGIDIEPEGNNSLMDNINLNNIKTSNCLYAGINTFITNVLFRSKMTVKIVGHEDKGSMYAIAVRRPNDETTIVNGFIDVLNPLYEESRRGSIKVINWDNNSPKLTIKNPKIIDTNNGGAYTSTKAESIKEGSAISIYFSNDSASTEKAGSVDIVKPFVQDTREPKQTNTAYYVEDLRYNPLSTKNIRLINPILLDYLNYELRIMGEWNIIDHYGYFKSDDSYFSTQISTTTSHGLITNLNTTAPRRVMIYDEAWEGVKFTLKNMNESLNPSYIDMEYLTSKELLPLDNSVGNRYLLSSNLGDSITLQKINGKWFVLNMVGDWYFSTTQ